MRFEARTCCVSCSMIIICVSALSLQEVKANSLKLDLCEVGISCDGLACTCHRVSVGM